MSPLIPTSLKVFQGQFEPGSRPAEAAKELLVAVIHGVISHLENILQGGQSPDSGRLASLVDLLGVFGDVVFEDEELGEVLSLELPSDSFFVNVMPCSRLSTNRCTKILRVY